MPEFEDEVRRRTNARTVKMRNRVTALALAALVVLFFAITVVKFPSLH